MRRAPDYVLSKYLGAVLGPSHAAGTLPWQVAISPNGMVLAIINETTNVHLVDTTTNTISHVVAGLVHAPILTEWVMAFTPDGTLLYVVDGGANHVLKIVVATGAVTLIPVGTSPQGLAISPDGAFVYVVNQTSNNITKVNVATDATSSIPVGFSLGGDIVITPDGVLAFVGGFSSNLVARVVLATGAVTTIDFGNHQAGIALTSDGQTLWCTTSVAFRSYTIATSTLNAAIPHGGGAGGTYIDPRNRYVMTFDFTGKRVRKLNIATSLVSSIVTGDGPNQIAISPDATLAYIACGDDNTLRRINLATDAVSAIPVGNGPYYVTYARNGLRLYVSSYNDNSFVVIDSLAAVA